MTEQIDETTHENEKAPSDTTASVGEDHHVPVPDNHPANPDDADPETFPKEYVVKLRDEAAKYRQRAADRDTLAERLHGALVAATGRLADPSDIAFDDSHIDDPEALTAAIDDLLTRKPHLATRKPSGDVGQGATGTADPVDLAGLLRRNAS